MKKIISILILGIVLTNPLFLYAEEGSGTTGGVSCIDGTEVTGVNNKHVYCTSSNIDCNGITWYAAAAWCQSQGRHLATIQEACGLDADALVPNRCQNLGGRLKYHAWTSSNYNANNSYFLKIGPYDIIDVSNSTRLDKGYCLQALCW